MHSTMMWVLLLELLLTPEGLRCQCCHHHSVDSACCSPSNSFMSKFHIGHVWITAPLHFTSLAEFVQHYLQCKRAAPADITALVPEFMLDGLRPLLTGKTLFKKYKKNTVLFDAPTFQQDDASCQAYTGRCTYLVTQSCRRSCCLCLLVRHVTPCTLL